jgi:hypothetical protein
MKNGSPFSVSNEFHLACKREERYERERKSENNPGDLIVALTEEEARCVPDEKPLAEWSHLFCPTFCCTTERLAGYWH